MLIIIAVDGRLCCQDFDLTLNFVLGNSQVIPRLESKKETKASSLITLSTVQQDHVPLLCRLMAAVS